MRGIVPDSQSDVYQYELATMDKRATAKRLLTSTSNKIPSQENTPETITMSCRSANNAKSENFLSNLSDIYIATHEKATSKDIKVVFNNLAPKVGPIVSIDNPPSSYGPTIFRIDSTTASLSDAEIDGILINTDL